ncbi:MULTISPECIES: FecCD family ABC transporter permease [Brevibacillus]|jgi:iron complex transport system permease protein|uniref:Corrinoid ABC transporter permease n=1 Tax=Brevibacillus parabrevis TaxID=54914 RepID=A0A4Y3PMP0_BREPA|nr:MULTISPECIES: iron ABC transporter permease [Brevibacillus]KZE47505.1 iron ABC transporter [Brevibacillus parabrevis]MDH6349593.1 iron complex transport system permease protein [Brevibacillus sp. 1238]MDR4999049.1 iron ABC transporter permease [Brevibacillus parabrevis]MED1725767.1 iron ABC transporter permease [Brevibacillus parabrevis]MED2254398.1 iron ABC transporter permease [Brevibacillus parabrevis]
MKKQLLLWGGASSLILLASAVVSISMGAASLPLSQVWLILLHQLPGMSDLVAVTWPDSSEQIVMKVRFPRVILAILVGACLSLAGAGFQGVLRNPLADPFTMGVASGAAVGAAFLILFGLQFAFLGEWSTPVVAFLTGLCSLWIVLSLAKTQGKLQTETLILSGVVIQAFLGSLVSFMVSLSNQTVNEIVFWLMGSLSFRGWAFTYVLIPYVLIGVIVLVGYARSLNLFALGERQAAHLGVNVDKTKLIILLVSTLLTAAAVSISGIIGFVGLVVPHLVRMLVGPDHRILLPMSAIGGGIYVLWADTLARMLLVPTEIPLGVVTAFLGAPFFAYLLKQNKRTGRR